MNQTKKRILTGDRPTGKLHLGHYVGTLANRVKLQSDYDCFFIIADLHTLTTAPTLEKTKSLKSNVNELVLDYLSVGINPDNCVIYRQSLVPEVTYLFTLFNMLVTVPRAQRIPSIKDVMRDSGIENPSMGLLSYPILQSADILMVKANLVPVGRDQESHLEITREIADSFNKTYQKNIFPLPETLIGDIGTLVGTDGQGKASKSKGNVIYLSDDDAALKAKIKSMYTDPTRIKATDPGHVEGNAVFAYLDAFSTVPVEVDELKSRYRAGQVGDSAVKDYLYTVLTNFLTPIREKRAFYEQKPDLIQDIITSGSKVARAEAQKTLQECLSAMGL